MPLASSPSQEVVSTGGPCGRTSSPFSSKATNAANCCRETVGVALPTSGSARSSAVKVSGIVRSSWPNSNSATPTKPSTEADASSNIESNVASRLSAIMNAPATKPTPAKMAIVVRTSRPRLARMPRRASLIVVMISHPGDGSCHRPRRLWARSSHQRFARRPGTAPGPSTRRTPDHG